VKFAFISEESVAFPVSVLCRVLEVSKSGYYAWTGRPPSKHLQRDADLRAQIRTAYKASTGRYGSPRVHAELRANRQRVSRKRVARLMREDLLVGRTRRRFRTTTDSNHPFPIAPNLLARDFTTTAPDKVWVTDITAIWTARGWLYLAAILDLFSRKVVGWATSQNVDRHLALAALTNAVRDRRPRAGLIHHSDRGSTYASGDYRKALRARGIRSSMSRKGDCFDNAVAESFFASLKREVVELDMLASHEQGTAIIADYIDTFYNLRRRHSTIGYKSPIEFELIKQSEAA
jgi:putative transposase